jgi:hypothetical protein
LVGKLIRVAGDDEDHWKMLVLALIRRRYHARAPEARAAEEDESDGDGERLLFYLATRAMQAAAQEGQPVASARAATAASVLCRAAPLAGGTRDICHLLEHLGMQAISGARGSGQLQPLGERVLPSLIDALCAFPLAPRIPPSQGECAERAANAPFFSLIAAAAEMLDADLELVQKNHAAAKKASGSGDVAQIEEHQGRARTRKRARESEPVEGGGGPPRNALTYEERVRLGGADRAQLMSTINTFLPHNDRGPSGSNRRLVQSLAEILIWAHTSATRQHPQFVAALEQLTALAGQSSGAAASASSPQEAEACVHKMQTIIRRLRKELSASARDQGFALSTEYTLNPTTITLKMLKRGKTGDLQLLQHLAKKAGDTRMLQLLARRNRDLGRAQPYDSIAALMRNWTPLNLQLESSAEGEPDELAALDRELQQGALLATIERLHRRLPQPPQQEERQQRTVTVACLENDAVNQAAAVVVAAAMQPAMITQESAAGSAEPQRRQRRRRRRC